MEGQLVGLGSRALDLLDPAGGTRRQRGDQAGVDRQGMARPHRGGKQPACSGRQPAQGARRRARRQYLRREQRRPRLQLRRPGDLARPAARTAAASIAPRRRETGLPRRPSRMLGRDADLGAISELLADHRFVTVHGPGGIGKTTVALAVAHEQAQAFRDGVRFLDLGLRSAHDDVAEVAGFGIGIDGAVGSTSRPASSTISTIARCCWSSTAASMSSTRRRRWRRPSSGKRRRSASWRPAAKRCAPRANTSMRWARSIRRRKGCPRRPAGARLSGRPALRRARSRQRSPRDVQRLRSTDRRRHLPQGRRHRAGPRARREPHQHPRPAGDGRSPR